MIVDVCESRLSVHIECTELRNMDWIGRSDPFAILFQDPTGASHLTAYNQNRDSLISPGPDEPNSSLPAVPSVSYHPVMPPPLLRQGSSRSRYPGRDSRWERVGKTETIPNSLKPVFATSFEIPYFFERSQKLAIDLFDRDAKSERYEDIHLHDYLGSAQVSVPALVRAPGQKLTIPLTITALPYQRCGYVTILVEEVSEQKQRLNYDISLTGLIRGLSFNRGQGPYLTISRKLASNHWTPVFRSLIPGKPTGHVRSSFDMGKLTYNYEKFCRCNDNVELRFEISYDRGGKHKQVASGISSLSTCHAADGIVTLETTRPTGCVPAGSRSVQLQLSNRSLVEETTFLDFVIGGCEISLVIGIDFTASNCHPAQPGSLHFWDSMKPNEYEMAIRAVGDILAAYDSDERFPAYGFGAKLPPDFQQPYHKFSLTNSPNPVCHTINEVLNMYRQTLYNVRLSGPTVFAEIIRAAAEHAAEEMREHEQSYTILLIVTDGTINDLDNTIEELRRAASLPLSVVIIGVGAQDFSDMRFLDDMKCERDIVQFVNFRQYQGTPEVLQSQVLEEIPGQFMQYMEKHGLKPMPPPVD